MVACSNVGLLTPRQLKLMTDAARINRLKYLGFIAAQSPHVVQTSTASWCPSYSRPNTLDVRLQQPAREGSEVQLTGPIWVVRGSLFGSPI